ncbi:MAG: hypothetical protein R3F29_05115 [Planctomycetota bacterium]
MAATLALVPQDPVAQDGQPKATDTVAITNLSDIQYTDLQGKTTTVSARNVVEVRLLEDVGLHVRVELVYENGDYSMIDAQSVHVLRHGTGSREVRLVRTNRAGMRFPRLPN